MSKKSRRSVERHRLLIYHQMGQRLRVLPFLIALASTILYFLGWMGSRHILEGGSQELLNALWSNRILLLLMIGASAALYVFTILIGRMSFVEARPKALHVRAGLVPVDISYGRIRQIRLVQLGAHYPPESLKGSEHGIIDLLSGATCSVIDLHSVPWPFTKQSLRRVWNKFMFTVDGGSLLLVVQDAMVLNQQIDGRLAAWQSRRKGGGRYLDPIERATQMQQQRARRGSKAPRQR